MKFNGGVIRKFYLYYYFLSPIGVQTPTMKGPVLCIFEPPISPTRHINFLYTCLSAKVTNRLGSKKIKFHKSLHAETGKLEGAHMRAYKTGP